MKHKLLNNKQGKEHLYDWMRRAFQSFPEDSKLEVIVREEISWDVAQMRKYFEGPVCKFIDKLFLEHEGKSVGKGVLREALKGKFIGFDGIIPISTTTLDHKRFHKFLLDIDHWCRNKFKIGLPEPDNCDLRN